MKETFINHVESAPAPYKKKIANLVVFIPVYTAIVYIALHCDLFATLFLSGGLTVFFLLFALSTKH